MTPPTPPDTGPLPARPTLLWCVSFAALGVFLLTWALSWMKAYVINDDLSNMCRDLRRQNFPPEVACASLDGTLTGANPGWIEALFFASLVVTVLFGTMALAIILVVRKK